MKALGYLSYSLLRFPGQRTKEKVYLILQQIPLISQLISAK
jgi:ABC-type maltose transport system permease subunit